MDSRERERRRRKGGEGVEVRCNARFPISEPFKSDVDLWVFRSNEIPLGRVRCKGIAACRWGKLNNQRARRVCQGPRPPVKYLLSSSLDLPAIESSRLLILCVINLPTDLLPRLLESYPRGGR